MARERLGDPRGASSSVREREGAAMFRRLTGWRFGVLLGVTLLDALIFAVPITALALVVLAVAAPELLRRAAAFLEALADGR
jgi:hypothetical protein